MAITQRRMTLEEFLELPEEEPALEYWDGMVTQKVSPKNKHGRLQWQLATLINLFSEPRKLAMAIPEARTTFAGASPVPDVVVYTWGRLPRDPDGELADDNVEPPDIAIEIVSPGQSASKLLQRCRWYVDNGVRIALLVNRRDRSVTRVRPGGDTMVLRGPDRIDLDPVLPDFAPTVQELFDSLRLD